VSDPIRDLAVKATQGLGYDGALEDSPVVSWLRLASDLARVAANLADALHDFCDYCGSCPDCGADGGNLASGHEDDCQAYAALAAYRALQERVKEQT
jgi:hypothetical protein